jgi:hypothetical protein
MQCVPPKRRLISTRLYDVTLHKRVLWAENRFYKPSSCSLTFKINIGELWWDLQTRQRYSLLPQGNADESQYILFLFFTQLSKFSNNQSQYKRECPLGHSTFVALSWSAIIDGKTPYRYYDLDIAMKKIPELVSFRGFNRKFNHSLYKFPND